jgi:mono/diheme cytochrome c family protein
MSRRTGWLFIAGLLLAGLAAAVAWRNLQGEAALTPDAQVGGADAALIARGADLARAGNCAACHTDRGGPAYAGGRAISTPFGTIYAGNLTPDPATGLGRWTAAEFWRALHHGRSRDGRLLYPAFPYPNFTLVTRADADALLAYLRSLAPVVRANLAPALRWPCSSQVALAIWRALYFTPASFQPDARLSAEWNRGAYLVNGLGHCGACHAGRNLLGASGRLNDPDAGSTLPGQQWYAPSLANPVESAAAGGTQADLVALLKTGMSARSAVLGPMAEVVAGSTQHLAAADLQAIAAYLQTLSRGATPAATGQGRRFARSADTMAKGAELYTRHCADCHGAQGQGAPGAYPPLAGNPVVTMADARNLVRIITTGGFAPGTAGNPRPYGMPAFDLPHADLAALTTWLRGAWAHDAAPLSELDMLRLR